VLFDSAEQRVDRRERHGEDDDLASINCFRVSGDFDRLARRVPVTTSRACSGSRDPTITRAPAAAKRCASPPP
jgi:hypothetical protein